MKLKLAPCLGFIIALSLPPATAQFRLEVAFPGLFFSRPVDLQHPGDGTNRIFVVEQAGVIRVFENSSTTTSAGVFLDIQAAVDDRGGEEGLLGLAFHPDFESNGYFYVNYTAANPSRTVIARYRVSAADSNRADPASGLVLLTIAQPFDNHNGGQLAFGPDGYLYIGMGDGGSGGDPQNHGQNRTTLLGDMLRIDVDNPSGGRNYGIPPDNPFVGNTSGFREEIFAYGFRNPWRFSFDPETGWLWAGDVGQSSREEIDLVENGKNYGWRIMEGNNCYNPPSNCNRTGLTLPVWDYPRSQGQSITGGYVYRGANVPELVGAYIYADFITGRIWALRYDGVNAPVNTQLLDTNLGIASFGVDKNNELYVCAFDGRIHRFTPTSTSVDDSDFQPAGFELAQNHPNPFNPSTLISYTLSEPAQADLSVYTLQGQLVRNLLVADQPAGNYSVTWDGRNNAGEKLASGVYLYRLKVGNQVATRRLILLKSL